MTSSGQWAAGVLVSERYQIESFLDQGAAGEVYSARNVWTDRPVAVKRLQPQHLSDSVTVERFLLEGRVGGSIEHPNVVQTFDMGRDPRDGSLFIVQELLRGVGMRDMLLKSLKVDFSDAMDLMLPVLGAVHTVHQHGIVHRDIKPENIFIAEGALGHRVPKLLDFGIAKVRLQETLTQRGTVLGTLDYMAPEQLLGEQDIDRRVDIWALGVVLYELFLGKLPFDAGHVGMTVNRILTQDPIPICELVSTVPRQIGEMVMSSLSKDRQHRPQSVQAMLETILRWALDSNGQAHRLINRHRCSIPASMEAKLETGAYPLPQSSWDELRSTALPSISLSSTRSYPDIPKERLGESIVIDMGEPEDEPKPKHGSADPGVLEGWEEEPAFELVRPKRALGVVSDEDEDDEFDETTVGSLPPELLLLRQEALDTQDPSANEASNWVAREVGSSAEAEMGIGTSEFDALEEDQEIDVTLEEAPLSSDGSSSILEVQTALGMNRFLDVIEVGDRAMVQMIGHPEAQMQVRLAQASASYWLGDFTAQQRFGVDAYYLAVPGAAVWLQAIGEIATASSLLGDHERLWDLMASLRSTPEASSRKAEMVIASCRLGMALHCAGWPEHVETVLGQLTTEMYDLVQESAIAQGWLCTLRGTLAEHAGDHVRSLRLMEEAREAFVAAGDKRWACVLQSDVGERTMGLGDYEGATEILEKALEEAEVLGIYGAVIRCRLAAVCNRLGQYDNGLALARAALEASTRAADWCGACQAHLVLAEISMLQGKIAMADLHARSAVEIAEPSTRARVNALGTLSLVLADRPLEALLAAVQAMEMLQAIGGTTEGEAKIRLAHAMALRALGHDGPARQAIETACHRLMLRASHIDDNALRERFLQGVKEHAQTLEMAQGQPSDPLKASLIGQETGDPDDLTGSDGSEASGQV